MPVVVTGCTGHADHVGSGEMMSDSVSIVTTGLGDGPTDDGPGAFAPIVTAEAIDEALERLFQQYERASQAAHWRHAFIAERWAWPLVLWESGLVSWIRSLGDPNAPHL